MESKLMNSQQFEFVKAKWDGTNKSGCRPIESFVLILVDEVLETSKGGIIFTNELMEKRQMAAETGTLVAMGAGAFYWNADRSRPYVGDDKPVVGDHVIFARYAGRIVVGNDGRQYRLMIDKEIGGVATDGGFSVTVKDQLG